ncbi:hypothetical protein [Pseudoxanthomonas mexicana]
MSANIILFPKSCSVPPPKTERQIRHERMAELLSKRAGCSIEKARAALTQAILSTKQ